MRFATLKNRFASYNDGTFLYDHLEYENILCNTAAQQIHDMYEIMYLKKGDIIYSVEGKSYPVKKGSLIFTRPEQRHSLCFKDKTVYERCDISFDKKSLSAEIGEKLPCDTDVISTGEYPAVNELFSRMDYYCKYFEGEDLRNLLCHLTEEIIYNIILIDKVFSKGADETPYSANPTVIKAVEYIEENIDKIFTLDDLCRELFITKSHLHRLFLSHLQITPKKYINSKRLLMAQKALRQGKKPAQIYQRCGFSEYSTFWREYKKYFGYSPSEESDKEIIREITF